MDRGVWQATVHGVSDTHTLLRGQNVSANQGSSQLPAIGIERASDQENRE